MPDLFKDMLKADESLFLDPLPLDVDFIPPIIEGREQEQQLIASCIKPLFNKRPGRNAFITGAPGIGKTLATKYLLQELERQTTDIYPIYINCWKKDSAHKIVLGMCDALGYKFTQNRTTGELMDEVTRIINKKAAVIILDEADKITDDSIIYQLLEDPYMKSLILISNEADYLTTLDNRIVSRLNAEVINFESYNYEEIYDILQKRVHHAFVADVFDKEAFDIIAQRTHSLRDLRAGLFLLKEAGEIAETAASRKITMQHTTQAIEKLDNFKIRSSETLNDTDKELLELIKKNSGKTTSEIFGSYQQTGGEKSLRTFQRKIDILLKNRVISKKEVATFPGRTTRLYYGSIKSLQDYQTEEENSDKT
ncbi:MAG TPA: AAA family ATPase [Candidatus Nanoarchaeia archaeon]|nr:AAA family ATPase [Candidatus Nanoarchaeia archaeon]